MKDNGKRRKQQIKKYVYLFELDSVRKTDEEIRKGQETLLDEIVLNGNIVVMTYNQLVDSRGFFSLLRGDAYGEKLIRLFEIGAIRISRFGDIRTVSQYLLNSIDDDKEFIYSALPIKFSQKRLIALMKRCLIYSDLSELNDHIKVPVEDMDEQSKQKLEDLFVEVRQGKEQPIERLSERDRNYRLGRWQDILRNLSGLLSTVLRISMLPDIYINPRNVNEYADLKFSNILEAVLDFQNLSDELLQHVDVTAFRMALTILSELDSWNKRNNNRSVYIREIKNRWETTKKTSQNNAILPYQYAEVIVNLCYNYACENSICNISKHYNVDELRKKAEDKPSFRMDFFARFEQDWRNGAGAKERYLAEETNDFIRFEDKDMQLYHQLERTVRLAEYIDYTEQEQEDADNRVVYRYEYKSEKQRKQNKRRMISRIARGAGLAAVCIVAACIIELWFNGLQGLLENFISFNTTVLGIIETILWLFVTEILSTGISKILPNLLPLSDAVREIKVSVVDGVRICRRRLSAYFSPSKEHIEQTEVYNAGDPIPYICPAELKQYRVMRKEKKEEHFAESEIYPIADAQDRELTEQLIRQEELFHLKYGVIYKSKYNTLIVDPIKGRNDIFPYERILPTGNDGVVMVATYKGSFVLLKQYRHAIRRMQYAFPRGFAEESDSNPAENAIRELQEELHAVITSQPVPLGRIAADSGLTGGCAFVYYVNIDSMELVDDHEGIIAIEQLSDEEFSSWISEGKIDDGFTLGAYTLYKLRAESEGKDCRI